MKIKKVLTTYGTSVKTALIVFLIAFSVQLVATSAYALDGIVTIISGGPVDTGGSSSDGYAQFLNKVRAHLPSADLYLFRLHNSKQQLACDDIAQHKLAHPEARISIAGHSYGADAAIWIAQCLAAKNIPVDLLLTLDTVARGGEYDPITVPENVKLNFHFYQQHDPILQGLGPNHRADQSARGIFNFNQNHGTSAVQSHLAVLSDLNKYDVGPTLAALAIQGKDENEIRAGSQSAMEKYLHDFPVESP